MASSKEKFEKKEIKTFQIVNELRTKKVEEGRANSPSSFFSLAISIRRSGEYESKRGWPQLALTQFSFKIFLWVSLGEGECAHVDIGNSLLPSLPT